MKSYSSFLHEMKTKAPHAIWVLGGAASGKSTIAEKSIVKGLKFVLIDVDKPFEEFLKKYNLPPDIRKSTDAEKAKAKLKRDKLKADIEAGKAKAPPAMKDLADPEDYFKTKKKITTNHASVVAREKTARLKDSTLAQKQNVVFVETGGQIGRIKNEKKAMEAMGYRTFVVYVGPYVDPDLEKPAVYKKFKDLIVKRGEKRRKGGGRGLDEKILETSLKQSIKVKKELLPLFKKDVFFVDTGEKSDLKKKMF